MRHGTTLTQTICLLDLRPKSLIDREDQLLAQWRRARSNHLQTGEIVLLYHRGFSEMQDERGSDVGVSDLVVLDDGAEFVEVEGGHDDACEASESWKVDETLQSFSYQPI
jgi:hypothetical protein